MWFEKKHKKVRYLNKTELIKVKFFMFNDIDRYIEGFHECKLNLILFSLRNEVNLICYSYAYICSLYVLRFNMIGMLFIYALFMSIASIAIY